MDERTDEQVGPDRRSILFLAALGAAGAGLAGLAAALGGPRQEGAAQAPKDDALGRAIASAREAGKPLLVLAVPEDEREIEARGNLLGMWFETASPRTLAALAMCAVTCASRRDVARHVEDLEVRRTPWMFLIETAGEKPVAMPIDGELPRTLFTQATWRDATRERGLYSSTWTAPITGWFEAAVAPDAAGVARRAAESRAKLSPADARSIDALAAGEAEAPLALVDRGAAVLRHATESDEARWTETLPLLAAAARERLLKQAPAGGRWLVDGSQCTDENANCPPCGMAFCEPVSRRFLEFYVAAGK